MSNPLKKLLGQTAVYGLSSIVGRLLNYLLVPLYTSVFANTADYGVVSELYAWVAFLIVFLTMGMETSFFKFLNEKGDKEEVFRNSFLTVIGVNLSFYLLLLLFHGSIADAMLYSEHPEYIIILGSIVCIDAVSALPLAKLRAENKAKLFATIQLTSIAINIILNLVVMLLVFDPSRPAEGVLFILIINLISSLVKPLFLYKDFLYLQFKLNLPLIKTMLFYAFPLVIAGFAGIINETIDRILLKHLLYDGDSLTSLEYANSQVGIYSANYKLAMLVTILLQAYRYAAEPFFFSLMKDEDKNKVYVKVMNFFVAAVCLVFLGVALNIDIFKHFIRNEDYHIGLGVVPVLLMANVFLGIYYNQSIWYKLSGQTRFGAYIATGGAIITIVMNVLLIPTIGFWASAWATLVVYAVQMVASYLLGQKYYPIPYNLRKFGLYLGLAVVLFFITYFMKLKFGLLQFMVHNGIILFYVFIVYSLEKNTLIPRKTIQ